MVESTGMAATASTSSIDNLSTMMAWNSVASAGTAICGAVANYYTYKYQSSVLDIQAEMQAENFQFQVDSSEVAKEAKIDLIQAELIKQDIQAEGQKKRNASIENRAKAEGEVAIQRAIKKDAETTKKFAETKISKTTIAKMFHVELRSPYFYGKPQRLA